MSGNSKFRFTSQAAESGIGEPSWILYLLVALACSPTRNVVLFLRVSSRKQIKDGTLQRMQEQCLAAILNAGCTLVAIVGYDKAQSGKSRWRPDLQRAVALAKKHNAIVVAWDVTRFIRPDSFHYKTNPFAEFSAADFARLRQIVGPDTVLAVIVPVEESMRVLRSEATKRGMKQAKIEGRWPGPKPKISDRDSQLMINDRADGASFDDLVKLYAYKRSTIVDHFKLVDPEGFFNRPAGRRKGR